MAGTLAAGLLSVETAAQAPPSPRNPPPPTATRPDPRPCEPLLEVEPRDPSLKRPPTTGAAPAPSLSDRLAKGEGVLCPPKGVDPEIVAPTPEVGRMPVIPPPGTPGGDPTVRPK